LRLLCYNINLRPPIKANLKKEYKDERLNKFLEFLPHFDIICLQEIFPQLNSRRKKLQAYAKSVGFSEISKPSSLPIFSKKVIGAGLLTLSKIKISKTDFIDFKYSSGYDSIVNKGVLYSSIKLTPKRSIHIFNLQLQSSKGFSSEEKLNFVVRLKQVVALRNIIDLLLNKNSTYATDDIFRDPVIVCGDFNIDARAPRIPTSTFTLNHRPANDWLAEKEEFSEYEFLLASLSNFGEFEVRELGWVDGVSPITYGDSYTDAKGNIHPKEHILTPKEDICSQRSTSHVLQIMPKGVEEVNLKVKAKLEPFYTEPLDQISQLSPHVGIVLEVSFPH